MKGRNCKLYESCRPQPPCLKLLLCVYSVSHPPQVWLMLLLLLSQKWSSSYAGNSICLNSNHTVYTCNTYTHAGAPRHYWKYWARTRTNIEDLWNVDRLCMPRSGGLKPLQNTHEYTHKLIQRQERRVLDRKFTHICRAHIHIGAHRTHVYIHVLAGSRHFYPPNHSWFYLSPLSKTNTWHWGIIFCAWGCDRCGTCRKSRDTSQPVNL